MMAGVSPDPAGPSLKSGDCERFARLVEERFGLHFSENRRAELKHGLLQAFAGSTANNLDDYYRSLADSHAGALEMDRLVNALTVGETYFFRDSGQFDALFDHVLPQIIERRRSIQTLRLWSAGCASGEEPYSLAMMLRELLPDVDDWAITILGTDVNTEALERARKALYGDWAFREERALRWRPRYFRKQGERHELMSQVRRMVTFEQLNLAGDRYPALETNTTVMDLILCRNVTIYFSPEATARVVEQLYDALGDGGWLVVGYSEASLLTYRRFQARNFPGAVLYQRGGQPAPAPVAWSWPAGPVGSRAPAAPARAVPAGLKARREPTPVLPAGADPVDRARELLEYGRSEEARELLLDRPGHPPDEASVCALLGRANANLGRWQEAEHWCGRAIQADRLALDAYYTLALVLQHQGHLLRAIDAMKKVVYINHNSVLGHYGLADLYYNVGQIPQALKALHNARRLLETRAADEVIAGSGGITAGRLRQAIVRQQQQWALPGTEHE